MHPRPRRHYILRRSENRFALKKLYDAHNPRFLPSKLKIILLTSHNSRAPSYLTSIAHLPRNVTTSDELSKTIFIRA